MAAEKVSLVTTFLNEQASIGEFLESVKAQTRPPDEVVLVDGGSRDRTVETVRQAVGDDPRFRLIEKPGNRSVGRNAGIETATGAIIAVTDAGCRLDAHWLEYIVAPLEADAAVGVASGYYAPDARTLLEQAVAAATVRTAGEENPETFLPSSRSVAFRKATWRKAGGYPEHQKYNEDTPFDLRMKAAGARFAFEPRAVVHWRQHPSLWRVFRQFYGYAVGDAQERIWFPHYTKAYAVFGVLVALVIAGIFAHRVWWGVLGVTALYWLRYTLRSKRRGFGWLASLLSPLVMATVDKAHVLGYAAGRLRRSR